MFSTGNENSSSGCGDLCGGVSVGQWLPPSPRAGLALVATTGANPEPAKPSITNNGTIGNVVQVDFALSIALSLGAAGVSGLAIKKAVEVGRAIANRKPDLLPPRETRRVQDLLAQAAILTKADRVSLGVFHNGHLSSRGYHMDCLLVAYQFERPAMPCLPEFLRDVPVADILRELEGLWQSPTRQVLFAKEDLKDNDLDCLSYLDRRGLEAVRFHLLNSGNTEVGIMSYQYTDWEAGQWDSVDVATLRKIEVELTDLCRRSSLQKPLTKKR